MKTVPRLLVVLAALAAAPALAHEKGDRAMGVVARAEPDRIVIKASDGHEVSFAVNAETRFFVGDTPAKAQDVQPGERAVVQGKRSGDALTAVRVKLAPRR